MRRFLNVFALLLVSAIISINFGQNSNRMRNNAHKQTLKEHKNIESILGLLKSFGTGDTSKINEYIDKDFINHMAPQGLKDRTGFKTIVKKVNFAFSLFDSYDVHPEHIFSKGDFVAMMDIGNGIKNGKKFNHTDIHIFKMRNGKLLEHWNSFRLPSQEIKMREFLESFNNNK